MKTPDRLLIVDEEADTRAFFRAVASEARFVVEEVVDPAELQGACERLKPTVILLDLNVSGSDGIELLRELANHRSTANILLTSGKDVRVLKTAQRVGWDLGLKIPAVLPKPVTAARLKEALEELWVDCPAVTFEEVGHAIEAGELILHFQPKFALQGGDVFPIIGSEALVRWLHPERGLVPPGDFLPVVEEAGLIGALTEVVLLQSIAQLEAWQQEGLALPLSINLSPTQLTDLTLPDRIARLLSEAAIDPALLIVEITEQAAMADVRKASEILTRLRLKNIAVSLDDFGAGYSSLIELYRMPLCELKLDRSLITDLDCDSDARTVAKAIILLAEALGLTVCAEGVETEQAVEFLQATGCQKAQGFYFSKPLSSSAFADFVAKQGAVAA